MMENLKRMQEEAEEEAARLSLEKENSERMDIAMKLEMEMKELQDADDSAKKKQEE